MKILKAEYWHWEAMQKAEGKRELLGLMDQELYIKTYVSMPCSFTLEHEGDILALMGIVPLWQTRGCGEIWMVRSKLLEKNGMGVARAVIRALAERAEGYWRLQGSCHSDDTVCRRFLEWLGFVHEADLPMYGPDREDYVQYRKLLCKPSHSS